MPLAARPRPHTTTKCRAKLLTTPCSLTQTDGLATWATSTKTCFKTKAPCNCLKMRPTTRIEIVGWCRVDKRWKSHFGMNLTVTFKTEAEWGTLWKLITTTSSSGKVVVTSTLLLKSTSDWGLWVPRAAWMPPLAGACWLPTQMELLMNSMLLNSSSERTGSLYPISSMPDSCAMLRKPLCTKNLIKLENNRWLEWLGRELRRPRQRPKKTSNVPDMMKLFRPRRGNPGRLWILSRGLNLTYKSESLTRGTSMLSWTDKICSQGAKIHLIPCKQENKS